MRKVFIAAIRTIALALAAVAAFVVTLVYEGGRWVVRTVRNAFVPPQEAAAAEAELDAEVEALRAEVKTIPEPQRLSAEEARRYAQDFGLAAMSYIVGDDAQRREALRGIDAATAAYLDSLSIGDAQTLLARTPMAIAAHLLRTETIPGLPRPLSPAEHLQATTARIHAEAEEIRRERAQREYVLDVLDDLIERPQYYPRAA